MDDDEDEIYSPKDLTLDDGDEVQDQDQDHEFEGGSSQDSFHEPLNSNPQEKSKPLPANRELR